MPTPKRSPKGDTPQSPYVPWRQRLGTWLSNNNIQDENAAKIEHGINELHAASDDLSDGQAIVALVARGPENRELLVCLVWGQVSPRTRKQYELQMRTTFEGLEHDWATRVRLDFPEEVPGEEAGYFLGLVGLTDEEEQGVRDLVMALGPRVRGLREALRKT